MKKSATKVLTPEEEDVRMLLACQAHVGCKKITTHMTPYVYARSPEGVHIFNPKLTMEKIRLAARIIAGIENPADVCVVSGRNYGQRAVLKFAKYTGCTALATRYTPGTFTNQIQKRFIEPRLLVVTDPITDHQPIIESSYVNIPVIAICDTDSPLRFIDVAIPSNNKGIKQIGIIYWMLAREVMRIRGQLSYKKKWDVMPDLFFFRETVERKKGEDEEEEIDEEGAGAVEGTHDRRVETMPEEEKKAIQSMEKEASAAASWGAPAESSAEGAAASSWADVAGEAPATGGDGWGGPVWA